MFRWVEEGFLEEVMVSAEFLRESGRGEQDRPPRQSRTKRRGRGCPRDALRGPEQNRVEGRAGTVGRLPPSPSPLQAPGSITALSELRELWFQCGGL